jgi:hypothetical protein
MSSPRKQRSANATHGDAVIFRKADEEQIAISTFGAGCVIIGSFLFVVGSICLYPKFGTEGELDGALVYTVASIFFVIDAGLAESAFVGLVQESADSQDCFNCISTQKVFLNAALLFVVGSLAFLPKFGAGGAAAGNCLFIIGCGMMNMVLVSDARSVLRLWQKQDNASARSWMLFTHRHFISEVNFILGNFIFILGCACGLAKGDAIDYVSGAPLAVDLFLVGSMFFLVGSIIAFSKPSKLEYGRMSYLEQVTAEDEEEEGGTASSESNALMGAGSYQGEGGAAC